MTIVYGTKSILLKKADPIALGITSLEPGSMIEVYQKCFTLFYVPVFPYKKEVVYSQGGERYHIPAELTSVTDNFKDSAKGKWYSFGMIWIILGLVAAYYALGMYAKYSQPKMWIVAHEKSVENMKMRLDRLDDRYVIFIQEVNAPEGGNVLYISKVNGDEVTVTVDMDSVEKRVKISDMKTAITEDYDDYTERKYTGKDLFGDGKIYTVYEVRMEFGPKIKIESANLAGEKNERYVFNMCNDGMPVTVENIKMLKGDMEWDLTFPFRFDTCMQMPGLTKSDLLEVELNVKDTLGRPYKYVFSNVSISNDYMDDVR